MKVYSGNIRHFRYVEIYRKYISKCWLKNSGKQFSFILFTTMPCFSMTAFRRHLFRSDFISTYWLQINIGSLFFWKKEYGVKNLHEQMNFRRNIRAIAFDTICINKTRQLTQLLHTRMQTIYFLDYSFPDGSQPADDHWRHGHPGSCGYRGQLYHLTGLLRKFKIKSLISTYGQLYNCTQCLWSLDQWWACALQC